MKVYGIGEKKTPIPFIAACDKFIYLEILKPVEPVVKQNVTAKAKSSSGRKKVKEPTQIAVVNPIEVANKGLSKVISDSINDLADENGWAFLGDLGNLILKKGVTPVIANGVDVERFATAEPMNLDRLGVPTGRSVFAVIAR